MSLCAQRLFKFITEILLNFENGLYFYIYLFTTNSFFKLKIIDSWDISSKT